MTHWAVIIVMLANVAAWSADVSPESRAAARERLRAVVALGTDLANQSRTSEETANARHPLKTHRAHYATLVTWAKPDGLPRQVHPWPRAEDAASLRELLHDRDPHLRALAAEALGSLTDPEDVPLIAGLLGDVADGPIALTEIHFAQALDRSLESPKTDDLDLRMEWTVRPVSAHAQQALKRMTGKILDATTFPPWWARNQNAQESLWYWQQRLTVGIESLRTPPPENHQDYPAWHITEAAQVAEWKLQIAATLRTLPPEVEAKIRLLAVHPHAGGADITRPTHTFFSGPVSLRLSPGRIKELLAREHLWPDVDWMDAANYSRMAERLLLSAESLFTAADAAWIQASVTRERPLVWWSGIAAGHIGISRLLPKAGNDQDDETTREGWLRKAIRDERDVFVRGYVVRELIDVGLPRGFEFIREHFFAATPTSHVPDFPQSVLDGLGAPPLTQAKRDALMALLLDPRSEPGWTGVDPIKSQHGRRWLPDARCLERQRARGARADHLPRVASADVQDGWTSGTTGSA